MNNNEIQAVKQRFGIIGKAPGLNHAIQVAMQVAPTDMTVLITGESGTGKESFSKIIHQLSPRKHGQFIAINCGAIPEGTIDSELFGHEKGAFTGASEARKGYFEVTNGGTIFLDEIGEMPLGTQARLLRVLENGEFIRVGSSKVQKTDVRVVAATNVNLDKAVESSKFREDLYYRLSTVPIFVPPLRERETDIELLFRKFSADHSEKYRVKPLKLNEEAREVLLKYRFPGNIRQLKNIVEQMSVLEMEREINAPTLERYLPDRGPYLPSLLTASGQKENGNERFTERELLYKVLFDMKKDMDELKKMVHQVLDNDNYDGSEIIREHQAFFDNMEEGANLPATDKGQYLLNPAEQSAPVPAPAPAEFEYDSVEDITHEPTEVEEESLSLEKKEKELIIKALHKNKNKRKYAAEDLGISERTLYRKIKQYEIDG